MEPQELGEAAAYADAQQDRGMPIYLDVELGMALIKVSSNIGRKFKTMPIKDADGNVTKIAMWVPTKYKELLTQDVTTAHCSPVELSVLWALQQTCAQIKSFADSHSSPNVSLDLSDSYNMIADNHNSIVVSSKATGKGAMMAKTNYARSESSKSYSVPGEKKKKGKTMLESLI